VDDYTKQTKEWLNNRFKRCDGDGTYIPHQPIYGFRKEPCEPGYVFRYLITFHTMRMLSMLAFDTILDVGAAEGYKAFLAKKFFGAKVISSDLSEEACKRAEEIFHITAIPADIHALPFDDDQFDVVMCSESLEHVTDFRSATKELLRVAKKAVVITVPHDPEDLVRNNKEQEKIHAHFHHFDITSFNYLKESGYEVIAKRIYSLLSVIPAALIDAKHRTHNKDWKHPKILTDVYNALLPVSTTLFGKKAAELLLMVDGMVCRLLPLYRATIFVIVKDKQCYLPSPTRRILPQEIIEFSLPLHRLGNGPSSQPL
jgi:SAM-dependent methyltransferase